MTRLIPGHDAPDAGSVQVGRQVGGLAGALVGALDRADERPVAERSVSLRSVPVEIGASPDVTGGGEANLGGPHCAAAHVALVAPLRRDTPDTPAVPLIGGPGAHDAHAAAAADITSTLWADFLAGRSPAARDRLVIHYRGLVRGVAGRMAGGLPTHVDAADLVQVGMFGLIEAVERFEPEREVRFESFAAQRIRGAMLDELRAQDWVPRTARARRREAERARERLETRLGRTVDDREVAEELGVALRELRGVLQHRQLVSVEALEAGGEGQVPVAELVPDESAPDPVEVVEHGETVRELVLAVDALGERDREVVRLYYLENRTLAEIGRLLGVTESRVCQLHSRLVTRLRTRLTEPA
ncbi:FliA/WhiG family RNA polymerase sigma factor [Pseudonocardia sp. RS010]|uniref:FliA/WhiG family RNA polymerase sigma factor n=1 Tax=Pseudonocardia sp. RS010 TaxID=3385979 RepID=UPI0039A0D042